VEAKKVNVVCGNLVFNIGDKRFNPSSRFYRSQKTTLKHLIKLGNDRCLDHRNSNAKELCCHTTRKWLTKHLFGTNEDEEDEGVCFQE
jgi:hypothetical protein